MHVDVDPGQNGDGLDQAAGVSQRFELFLPRHSAFAARAQNVPFPAFGPTSVTHQNQLSNLTPACCPASLEPAWRSSRRPAVRRRAGTAYCCRQKRLRRDSFSALGYQQTNPGVQRQEYTHVTVWGQVRPQTVALPPLGAHFFDFAPPFTSPASCAIRSRRVSLFSMSLFVFFIVLPRFLHLRLPTANEIATLLCAWRLRFLVRLLSIAPCGARSSMRPGIAGVGLALIAARCPSPEGWDGLLLPGQAADAG
jgi:hypothetical protein